MSRNTWDINEWLEHGGPCDHCGRPTLERVCETCRTRLASRPGFVPEILIFVALAVAGLAMLEAAPLEDTVHFLFAVWWTAGTVTAAALLLLVDRGWIEL